jgi:hypothetical protein
MSNGDAPTTLAVRMRRSAAHAFAHQCLVGKLQMLSTRARCCRYIFESNFPAIGIQKTTFDDKARCYAALKDKAVDAVFGVREEFVYYFSQGLGAGMLISPVVKGQEYGESLGRGRGTSLDRFSHLLLPAGGARMKERKKDLRPLPGVR